MSVTTSGRSGAPKALHTATYDGTIIYNDPVSVISVIAFSIQNDDRIDMILLTHYFCDFNCLLLLLNHILLRKVFFCQNLTFITH
jgi:hypothetical protein